MGLSILTFIGFTMKDSLCFFLFLFLYIVFFSIFLFFSNDFLFIIVLHW